MSKRLLAREVWSCVFVRAEGILHHLGLEEEEEEGGVPLRNVLYRDVYNAESHCSVIILELLFLTRRNNV